MDHRGISAVATAVALVLERSWAPGIIEGISAQFAAYRSRDLAQPMATGLSVVVTRVSDVPQARPLPRRGRPPAGVSLEVYFLLTAWGETAAVEQSLLGWGACVLSDHPVLDANLLNDAVPGVCPSEEVVQLRTADAGPGGGGPGPSLPADLPLSLPYVTSAVHLGLG